MSTQLAPVLFLAATDTQDLATNFTNDWETIPNVLLENTDFTYTIWSISDFRYSYALNLSQPDFPAYPAGEEPVWFQLTVRMQAFNSTRGIESLHVQMDTGTRRSFSAPDESEGVVTRTYAGYLSDWGITVAQAEAIINGTASVNFYGRSEDPDSQLNVLWAKLEALVQEPQTEVLSPPSVF